MGSEYMSDTKAVSTVSKMSAGGDCTFATVELSLPELHWFSENVRGTGAVST
jgi:hypothetical protein